MAKKKKTQNPLIPSDSADAPIKNETGRLKDELIAVNKELDFQNEEKEKRASELVLANKDLAFETKEKGKRAAELVIANEEKEKHAVELATANLNADLSKKREEKSGADLAIANKEILMQKNDKKARAAELVIANKELAFQKKEKKARAAELAIANKELAYQEREKKKRAAELIILNKKFVSEHKERMKREVQLSKAKLKLQRKEQQCRFVVESSPSPMLLINKNGIITLANKPAEMLFGYECNELATNSLEICIPEICILGDEDNFIARKKNGSKLLIEVSFIPLEASRGPMILVCISEITEKKTQEAIEKRQNDLEAKSRETEQFAYLTSHDLQEPLRTVTNYMQLFEKNYIEVLDENAIHYLNTINNATRRMDTLVKSIMSFSRLGNGNKKLALVDCRKVIDEVISDLGGLIRISNTIIEITAMPELNVYDIEFRQLFQNLIVNAIKFCKKGDSPVIRICSEKINGKWKFSVCDNGIGIAQIHFKRVFDIFQRINPNTEYEGHGCGLANCRKIVQLHHGEIWLESVLGEGSKFHFTIPG
jgi:signal transduction histidine kinase